MLVCADGEQDFAMIKQAVEYIVKELVDFPSQVEVTQSTDDDKIILEVRVAKEDLGKIIGKGGQTVRSLRLLLHAMTKQNCELTIVDIQAP